MTRTISRMSVSTKLSVTSPPGPATTCCVADANTGTFAAPRASKLGSRSRPLGMGPLTRGSAACNRLGASSGARPGCTDAPSHAAKKPSSIKPLAGSGRTRPGLDIIVAVSTRPGTEAGSGGWADAPRADSPLRAAARLRLGRAEPQRASAEVVPARWADAWQRERVGRALAARDRPLPLQGEPAVRLVPGLDRFSARAFAT